MAHQPEPADSPYPTVQLGAASPGQAFVDVRVTPEHAEELRELLEAEGLNVSDVLELSAGEWLQILAVTLPVALGAGMRPGGAITVAIAKFFDKRKGAKVNFGPKGEVRTMEGVSVAEIERVLEIVHQQQLELNQSWAKVQAEYDQRDESSSSS